MNTSPTPAPTARKPLRLWPGIAAAVLLLVLRFLVPVVFPDGGLVAILGALGLIILAMAATRLFLLHPSIAGGNMGLLYFLYSLPGIAVALVVWAVATRRLPDIHRHAAMAAT
ncbi:MAG TPA: hypothetical protein VFZ36_05980, partial [Vicinamibacterales bacterium]